MEKTQIIQYNKNMYYRRTRLFLKIFISQLAVGLLILITGLTIVFYAQGLRLNLKNFKIIKTGVISVSAQPKESDVYVNNVLESHKTSFSKNVTPGFYDLTVKKHGYIDWNYRAKVESGLVFSNKDIVLFLQNIKATSLTDKNKISQLNQPVDILAINSANNLSVNPHEIWVSNNLILRLSDTIYNAIWYPDNGHIVYQEANQIRVIDINGYNDTLLVTLAKDAQTDFVIGNSGTELYFKDDGEYEMAVIR